MKRRGWRTLMTCREALGAAAARLADITDTPRLDAELLMAHALGVSREALLLSRLDQPRPDAFAALLARRMAREPLAYITGTRDFWTISLQVAPGVLIPRPDSETLIEAALAHFSGEGPQRILDLGTGSGALLLAALSEWPDAYGLGIDASPVAIEIASSNASRLGLAADFREGDWCAGVTGPFDLILCNPPYVESGAQLSPEVMNEPHDALFAGPDGLGDYRLLAAQIPPLIACSGCAVIEIGHDQAGPVTALFAANGLNVALSHDLAGKDRCLTVTYAS
jgi:release factor glutamine methyltransferase